MQFLCGLTQKRVLQFFKFLLSGSINTFFTWIIYIYLLRFISYKFSYTLAFAVGVIFSYLSGRYFVFQRHGVRSAFLWVLLVYLLQYMAGIVIVSFVANISSLLIDWAPLISAAIVVPLTYIFSSLIFTGTCEN